jgi:autotransporter-associated beta strand protein
VKLIIRKNHPQSRRLWQSFTLISGITLAALCCATHAFAGQGAASYIDFNGSDPGFGTPTDTSESATNWTVSAAGTTNTTAKTSGAQLTIGNAVSDFGGPSRVAFSINMDGAGNLQGVLINSSNVDVTFTGNSNEHNNSAPNTWTITNLATLTVNDTRQSFGTGASGFNWNSVAVTFQGGGTFNFPTPFGANSTSSNIDSMLPSGVINMSMSPITSVSTYTGGFILNSGTLNFASAGSANAFNGFAAGRPFTIKGGVIDNTSGSPISMTVGPGGYMLTGTLTFTGSSSLDFGTAPLTNTASHIVMVGANTLSIGGVISGPATGLTKTGTGTLLLYGANTYSGNTLVGAGTLSLTNGGSLSNSPVIVTNSTLDLSGLSTTTVLPALSISNSTLVVADLSTATNILTTTLSVGGTTNIVNITKLPILTGYPAVFRIIKATTVNGTLNFGLGTLPSMPAYVGYISNNTANSSVDLVITNGPPPANLLTWTGTNANTGLPDGTWDVNDAQTWAIGGAATNFNESDFVTFDDSAPGQTVINLSGSLQPGGLLVSNNTKSYTFINGSILDNVVGGLALNKRGSGTLLLQESGDSFTGGINVSGGAVIVDSDISGITGGATIGGGALMQVGTNDTAGVLPSGTIVNNGTLLFNRADNFTVNDGIAGNGVVQQFNTNTVTLAASGSGNWTAIVTNGTIQVASLGSLGAQPGGAVTVTNGGTLDVGGFTSQNTANFGAKQFIVSGTGVGGNGAIVNSGSVQQQNAFQNVLLTSDTTFGGPTRWDIRGGTALLDLGGFTLTKTNANQISLVSPRVTSGNIIIQQGVLSFESTPNFTNTTGTITVNSGGFVGQFKDTAGSFTRSIVLNGGGTTNLSGAGSVTFVDAPILLTADSTLGSPSGTEFFNGAISDGGNGFAIIEVGLGTNYLTGTNTYTGNTVITAGTLGLTNQGSIARSATIIVTNGATFNVSGLAAPFTGTNSLVLGDDANGSGALPLGTLPAAINSLTLNSASITISITNTSVVNMTVTNLNLGDGTIGSQIFVTNLPPTIGVGQYPVIKYSNVTGTYTLSLGSVPNNFGAQLVNNPGNHSIDLQITSLPPGIWNGGGSANDNNWSDAANWRGTALNGSDNLTFTGTAGLLNTNDTANEAATGITFAPGAGSFTLTGNGVPLSGNVVNASSNPQTIDLGLSFGTSVTLDGGAAGLTIGGGLTNTFGAPGSTTLTLAGTGTLTNLLSSTNNPGGTNSFATIAGANWTLMDNSTATPMTVPWPINFQAGTFTFGSASSAPNLNSTSAQGGPQDNQIGTVAGAVGTLNMLNGILTTRARLNTATASSCTGIVSQVGGTLNIGSQIQGANNATTNGQSIFNISGGTLNVGGTNAASAGGQFYVASRDLGTLTVSGTATVNCGNLDLSRNANGNSRGTMGVVSLNGGTLSVGRVGTATANSQAGPPSSGINPTATFNFNGGTLLANYNITNNTTAFFQGSTAAPAIPIATIVKAGGAIIDDGGFAITIAEPLQHDTNLLSTADGGLTKNGSGTNTLSRNNTYTGNTTVNAGSLALSGTGSISNSPNIILANSAILDASARVDGTLTLVNGQTLQNTGSATVIGSLTNGAGATVSPGGSGTIGSLAVTTNAALSGAVAMDISKTGTLTNDQITAGSSITFGGTLTVTLDTGTPAAGDTFQLFTAASFNGNFSATNLPTLAAGLAWNWNPANGALSVVSTTGPGMFTQPTGITSFALNNGTNVVMNGTNGQAGDAYYLLQSTNVALPLSQWKTVATNVLGANGNYTFTGTNVVIPGARQQFFIIGNTNLNP